MVTPFSTTTPVHACATSTATGITVASHTQTAQPPRDTRFDVTQSSDPAFQSTSENPPSVNRRTSHVLSLTRFLRGSIQQPDAPSTTASHHHTAAAPTQRVDVPAILRAAEQLLVLSTVDRRMLDKLAGASRDIQRARTPPDIKNILTWAGAGVRLREERLSSLEILRQRLEIPFLRLAHALSTNPHDDDARRDMPEVKDAIAQLDRLIAAAKADVSIARDQLSATGEPAHNKSLDLLKLATPQPLPAPGTPSAGTSGALQDLVVQATKNLRTMSTFVNEVQAHSAAADEADRHADAMAAYQKAVNAHAVVGQLAGDARTFARQMRRAAPREATSFSAAKETPSHFLAEQKRLMHLSSEAVKIAETATRRLAAVKN